MQRQTSSFLKSFSFLTLSILYFRQPVHSFFFLAFFSVHFHLFFRFPCTPVLLSLLYLFSILSSISSFFSSFSSYFLSPVLLPLLMSLSFIFGILSSPFISSLLISFHRLSRQHSALRNPDSVRRSTTVNHSGDRVESSHENRPFRLTFLFTCVESRILDEHGIEIIRAVPGDEDEVFQRRYIN